MQRVARQALSLSRYFSAGAKEFAQEARFGVAPAAANAFQVRLLACSAQNGPFDGSGSALNRRLGCPTQQSRDEGRNLRVFSHWWLCKECVRAL